jgi:hypothetical protein
LEVGRDSLHQSLRTAHRLLRFPLADMCGTIIAFMAEGQQIWHDPA